MPTLHFCKDSLHSPQAKKAHTTDYQPISNFGTGIVNDYANQLNNRKADQSAASVLEVVLLVTIAAVAIQALHLMRTKPADALKKE